MNHSPRLAWVRYRFPPASGMARGYLSSAFFLHEALSRAYSCFEDHLPKPSTAKVRIHYCPPHFFMPEASKFDVLFTMWEGLGLPDDLRMRVEAADLVMTPSKTSAAVLASPTTRPIVVPLGVPKEYLDISPDRPLLSHTARQFRVLWVGSTLARKGWEELAPIWRAFHSRRPNSHLLVKTMTEARDMREHAGAGMTVDGRDIEPVEMLQLYTEADVLLSTSRGEGFGLPLLEAMAAGCLVVAPSALTDFVSDRTAVQVPRTRPVVVEYGTRFKLAIPRPEDYVRELLRVADAWGTADLEARRRAGCFLARSMTWDATAEALLTALEATQSRRPGELFERRPKAAGDVPPLRETQSATI